MAELILMVIVIASILIAVTGTPVGDITWLRKNWVTVTIAWAVIVTLMALLIFM